MLHNVLVRVTITLTLTLVQLEKTRHMFHYPIIWEAKTYCCPVKSLKTELHSTQPHLGNW